MPDINILFLQNDTHALTPAQQSAVASVVQKAAKDASALIPLPAIVNLTVNPDPFFCIPETGEGGYTPTRYWIQLSLDPTDAERMMKTVHEIVPSTMHHELHHASRHVEPGYGRTLKEAVVSEGLATVYAEEAFPSFRAPWAEVSDEEAAEYWEKAKADWENSTYDHAAYFFGTGELPKWLGYKLGTWIVRQAVASGTSAAEMVDWTADRVLERAKIVS